MKTYLYHPIYGEGGALTAPHLFTGPSGLMVGGYWGGWRIFANLPASEVEVRVLDGDDCVDCGGYVPRSEQPTHDCRGV